MAVAYVDGIHPSIVVGRGIYGPFNGTYAARNELTAWNWRGGELTLEWWFKAGIGINDDVNSEFIGQGTHGIAVADVDGDGKDEIVFGAMVVDDNGTGLYSTGRGHGDALHVAEMDLSNPGLEIFMPQEDTSVGNHTASIIRDAATGQILAAPLVTPADVAAGAFPDVGRGIALDIDPNYPGYEFWDSYDPSIYDSHGNPIYDKPSNMHQNFGVWWDADLLRETLDGTTIGDWNYTTHGRQNLVSFGNSGINSTAGLSANNGTKSTPALSGDILGDWREEVIWRTSDNTALQIWSTTITATNRLVTLVHDSQYREALAWQNVGYNQPPNPSFFLGAGMATPPQPSIYFPGELPGDYNDDGSVNAADYTVWRNALGSTTILPNDTTPGMVTDDDYRVWKLFFGTTADAGSAAVSSRANLQTAPVAVKTIEDATKGAATGVASSLPLPATSTSASAGNHRVLRRLTTRHDAVDSAILLLSIHQHVDRPEGADLGDMSASDGDDENSEAYAESVDCYFERHSLAGVAARFGHEKFRL
jgi:hypothetical protein